MKFVFAMQIVYGGVKLYGQSHRKERIQTIQTANNKCILLGLNAIASIKVPSMITLLVGTISLEMASQDLGKCCCESVCFIIL